MPRLNIWKSVLERAVIRCEPSAEDAQIMADLMDGQSGDIQVDPQELPVAVARSLLQDSKIKGHDRAVLTLRVLGMKSTDKLDVEELYGIEVSSPSEVASVLMTMSRGRPNADLQWNDRWYPVIVLGEVLDADRERNRAHISVRLGMGGEVVNYSRAIDTSMFLTPSGQRVTRTVLEIFERLGFRRLQTEPAAFNLRMVKAERWTGEPGKQVLVRGAVLERGRHWFESDLSQVSLGSEETPRRCVVEPSLGSSGDGRGFNPSRNAGAVGEDVSRMPMVRVFSFDFKRYVFADVDDIVEYEYDDRAVDKLYLPAEMRGLLESVFNANRARIFGDILHNKHGGVVILACGSPGVGKTMTAEAYAEVTGRPLYVLEFGELGTKVEEIEHSLETIFARVVRWRAVLQFDECEIFLATRGEDLERSAIVGIFLRMLDYYEGLLFLTTNRPEVLDAAIKSRVMLRLDYPDLNSAARHKIWQSMLDAAGMQLTEGDAGLAKLAEHDLNGRQIRNLVRLTHIIHPQREVGQAAVESLMRFISR